MNNYWKESSSNLVTAYLKHASTMPGKLRFELVTRALLQCMTLGHKRIVDIGGGLGIQAIMLARHGHFVTLIDSDEQMIAAAEKLLQLEHSEIRSRVSIVRSSAESAKQLVDEEFDIVCCHSVLMYEQNPASMIKILVDLAKEDGIISILSLNTKAIGMRSGLLRQWDKAIKGVVFGVEDGEDAISAEHSLDEILTLMKDQGWQLKQWYGVRVFTDHLFDEEIPSENEFNKIIELEWEAGSRDPYRHVSRLFHLLLVKR